MSLGSHREEEDTQHVGTAEGEEGQATRRGAIDLHPSRGKNECRTRADCAYHAACRTG